MRIVLGVSGGIAAYKAAELVRALEERALTGRKVITEMFGSASGEATLESAIEHIAVAQRCECLVVAPASADILAKFANGIADDFLSTLYLAYNGPVVAAPAMNSNMWAHPATQANLARLRERGVRVVEPAE